MGWVFLQIVNSENSLTILSRAAVMLAEANTIQKAKELKNLALTASDWAKRKGMGAETIALCRTYALEAERKMGEMLLATERAKPVNPKPPKHRRSPTDTDDAPTLAEIGVTKRESADAQKLATLPKTVFEDVKTGKKTRSKAVRETKAAERKETLKVTEWPADKYRVIYADPPWQYGDARTGTQDSGGVAGQYETMSLDSICAMKVKDIALKDSVLFLWATSPLIPEAIQVIEAWGFKYKASFVWNKVRGFNGHYNDVQHELLLIATRGSCTPENDSLFKSVVQVEKDKHSKKPEQFRQMIDTMYPSGPRLELFARNTAPNWKAWGNEV